jgi:predicted MFS family arabinose efflux permease
LIVWWWGWCHRMRALDPAQLAREFPQPGFSSLETVTLARPATAAPSTPVVAVICAAEILGLAGFSIIPALLPQFIEVWSLTNTQAGWLAGIASAGYMLAVIPLVGLTDRRPARQIYLASSVLSALSCFGMALCDSLLPALGFRALGGIAMAGMYMPGLRALTHGVEGATRARIAAWYTSSFTIGASLSFLFGRVGTLLGWRSAFVIAGILGAAGVLIAWAALPRGNYAAEGDPQPLLDFRPVLANRDVLALMVGYAAAIWGCVGLRQWIVVFLTFRAGDQAAVPAQAWIILVVGAVINFLGVPAGLIGKRAVDPLRLTHHRDPGLRALGGCRRLVRLRGDAALHRRARTFRDCGLHRAGQLLESHFGRVDRCRPALPGGNDRALFLHRLWRQLPRHTPVRRHARSIRRDVSARRLGAELRHQRTRLPGRCRGDRFPAPELFATVTWLGGAGRHGLHRASYAETAQKNRPVRVTRARWQNAKPTEASFGDRPRGNCFCLS